MPTFASLFVSSSLIGCYMFYRKSQKHLAIFMSPGKIAAFVNEFFYLFNLNDLLNYLGIAPVLFIIGIRNPGSHEIA